VSLLSAELISRRGGEETCTLMYPQVIHPFFFFLLCSHIRMCTPPLQTLWQTPSLMQLYFRGQVLRPLAAIFFSPIRFRVILIEILRWEEHHIPPRWSLFSAPSFLTTLLSRYFPSGVFHRFPFRCCEVEPRPACFSFL